ncbi:unnamed protein product [Lepeophtheirus salmonis]|uniref:(salmon louse) hypothetical protein n=1 Tax=Lepeophtheirus salmonis TaxID=72036 RepID=A0A817FED0_LEPSM|nr:unnamed protein product [Lepeophtheirus salmonis]
MKLTANLTGRNYFKTVCNFVSLLGNFNVWWFHIPPTKVLEYFEELQGDYNVIHAKKSIDAVIEHFIYMKGNATNTILMEMSHHILLSFHAINTNLKDASWEGGRFVHTTLRRGRPPSLFVSTFTTVESCIKNDSAGPREFADPSTKRWVWFFFFLEGQRGGTCLNLMSSEFMERV